MRGSHLFIGQASVPDIDAGQKGRATFEGLVEAEIRHGFQIWEGRVRQRLGSGPSVSSRHIRHAIVDNPLLLKNRMGMRGGPRSFRTSALVDRDVHKDASGLHQFEHRAGDEFRGL